MNLDPRIRLQDAIDELGSVSNLARLLGYSRARVYQWIDEEREYLPPLAAWRLEERRSKQSGS